MYLMMFAVLGAVVVCSVILGGYGLIFSGAIAAAAIGSTSGQTDGGRA